MNATRWIGIVAVAAATGLTGTAIANETNSTTGDHSSTGINNNSAAQLGPATSATPQRKGDSSAKHGSDNSAAQMGSGLNANPGAQLNNDVKATSEPPADSEGNTPEKPSKTRSPTETKSQK